MIRLLKMSNSPVTSSAIEPAAAALATAREISITHSYMAVMLVLLLRDPCF
jgi:hypothetical protein